MQKSELVVLGVFVSFLLWASIKLIEAQGDMVAPRSAFVCSTIADARVCVQKKI